MRISPGRVVLALAFASFLGVLCVWNVRLGSEQQFTHLARSFLHGQLAFLDSPGSWADTTPHDGRYYWPLGPLPAVVLMPFVWLADGAGVVFRQGYLQPLLVLLVLGLVARIARRIGYSREDAGYLAFGFAFSTAFLGVGMWPWSWYFSQVVTSVLLFAAIDEMLGHRRPARLGVFFALALATRSTAALGIVWPILDILDARETWNRRFRSLATLAMPIAAMLGLLALYNYGRFGNPFEQGYAAQIIPPHAAAARAYGLLSLAHVPGNLYHLLLAAPVPIRHDDASFVLGYPFVAANPWGMSIAITSPCLLCLFGLRLRDATSRRLLLTVVMIATPLVLYYGIGYRQFGYRYSLDFVPFLYVLLLLAWREQRGDLTTRFKTLLVVSALINLHLFAGQFLALGQG